MTIKVKRSTNCALKSRETWPSNLLTTENFRPARTYTLVKLGTRASLQRSSTADDERWKLDRFNTLPRLSELNEKIWSVNAGRLSAMPCNATSGQRCGARFWSRIDHWQLVSHFTNMLSVKGKFRQDNNLESKTETWDLEEKIVDSQSMNVKKGIVH